MRTLQDILHQRSLSALFQPVMNISAGTFLGFEGLIRGPADSPLHSPINLFAAAKQQGLSLEVEMLCRQIVLESFAAQNLPGNLFLNVSPDALSHPSFKNGQTLAYLENLGIDPQRVIIEITENQPTFDFEGMRNALLHYRNMGFQIALIQYVLKRFHYKCPVDGMRSRIAAGCCRRVKTKLQNDYRAPAGEKVVLRLPKILVLITPDILIIV